MPRSVQQRDEKKRVTMSQTFFSSCCLQALLQPFVAEYRGSEHEAGSRGPNRFSQTSGWHEEDEWTPRF